MYIIEVDKLYSESTGDLFGYVGLEYGTGKLRYFTRYDNLGIYHGDKIFEIDNSITNILIKQQCKKQTQFSRKLPSQIKEIVSSQLKSHMKYNINNHYPTTSFKTNKTTISFQYVNFKSLRSNVIYVPVENKVQLNVTKKDWIHFDEQQINRYEQEMLHELGHMKVSSIKLDEQINELHVKTGFIHAIYTYEPIRLSNGDTFLMFVYEKNTRQNKYEEILEEMMNEYECRQIDPNYLATYPSFGKVLNELCDGRLGLARYKGGIDKYYESMARIIKDQYLAEELLESIISIEKSYEWEYEKNMNYTLKLIKRYEKAKKVKD